MSPLRRMHKQRSDLSNVKGYSSYRKSTNSKSGFMSATQNSSPFKNMSPLRRQKYWVAESPKKLQEKLNKINNIEFSMT